MKKILIISMMLILVFAVAACGTSTPKKAADNNNQTTKTTTSTSTSQSTQTTKKAEPNDMLSKIQKRGTLIIAESAYAPQDFQDPKTKEWTGYDVNVLKGFAKSLGVQLKVDAMPFASSIQAVADKRDDITIDIYWTAKRYKVLDFSRPMLNYNDVIAVNSKNPTVKAATLDALKGKTIAVVQGSAEVPEAKKVPGAKVKIYNTVAQTFLALSSGRVDAAIQPNIDVSWSVHKNPSLKIKILGGVPSSIAPPIESLRGYYGVPKGADYNKRLLDKLNVYLKKIVSDGTEQKILDNYGMTSDVFLKGLADAPDIYTGK